MKKKMTKAEEKFITDMAFSICNYNRQSLSEKMRRVWRRRKEREKVVHNRKLPCKQ